MTEQEKQWHDDLMRFLENYCEIVTNGLNERWQKFKIEIYEKETYEAIGGLLARQATLSTQLAMAPQIWNPHIAPLILRCMTDAHITLAWILRNHKDRASKYILYGLGQEKLYLEHLKKSEEEDGKDERVQKVIKLREAWLNSQKWEFMTEVDVGSWSGMNTRDMAKEAECESLYNFAYLPFSGSTHNMWQHVGIYNLKNCRNPLHKYHSVPTITETRLSTDFVYRSAKYVDRSYGLFDKTFGISVSTPMPHEWFVREYEKRLGKDHSDAGREELEAGSN
jgi:hypothetical protein